MTTLNPTETTCGVCGATCAITEVMSTNQFGSPDLDLRPAEMARSTMYYWVHRCDSCGYCAGDLAEGDPSEKSVIQQPDYQAHLNNTHRPELANSFLCLSLLQQSQSLHHPAAWSVIHAAWACDDAQLDSEASTCRLQAADMLKNILNAPDSDLDPEQIEGSLTVSLDLLRRAGQFEAAQHLLEDNRLGSVGNPVIRAILPFQQTLINARDTAAHTLDEINGIKDLADEE